MQNRNRLGALAPTGWKSTSKLNLNCACLASSVLLSLTASYGHAEVFELEPVVVHGDAIHPSQKNRRNVEQTFTDPRSSSATSGGLLQNLNEVNTSDALRFTTTGLINTPGSDRFGGPLRIRTFGDWGASTSIDGLPAVKFADEEGGGYSSSRIPTIAIEQIDVHKGGRGVQFGNGSDGGVFQTNIKSGRGYTNHFGGTLDFSTAGESILQLEAANGTEKSDYYVAGSGLYGDFDGTDEPANLDKQTIGSFVGKVGFNPSEATRIEVLGIFSKSDTNMYRNEEVNEIESDTAYASVNLDHALSDTTSVRAGYLHSDTGTVWEARDRDRSTKIDTLFADYFMVTDLSSRVRYSGSAGVEYKTTNTLRDKQWDNTFNDPALKLTNSLTFNENAIITLGLRNTWLDNDIVVNGETQEDTLKDDSVFSWELGGAYSVAESTRLRASAATGFNRFYEKYGNFGSDALNPVGAGDDIVESVSYEIGVNQGFSKGFVDLAFYTITQENVPRRENGAIMNVEVEQSGIELEALSKLTEKFTLSAGYNHVFDVEATREDGTDANGNIFFGSNGVNVAHHQLTLRFDYRWTDTFSVWGAGIHGEPFERVNEDGVTETRREPYQRLDLGAALWVSDNIAARIRAENITDEKDFSSTLEGAPIDTEGKLGRVFWVGVDFSL